ncbi:IS256 family transposase [Streptomyces alanosinicus]|nr:IS256 family transposase [Streptomyces alanosinicus]
MLVERARSEGLQLTGQDGLLQQLTKRVLESALEGEITDHLGHDKHDAVGRGSGNSRNGGRAKTVLTDVGPVEVKVPRDTSGTFESQIVKKRQRRLTGVDEMVLSLSAKGLTHGEISAHLAEVYGAEVSKQTISTISDQVMDGMAAWQSRPLDRVYPVLFVDAINVKIRDQPVANRPIYLVMAVTVEGERDILGIWAGDGGEGAKYWLQVFTELKNRGLDDVLMLVCDGLKGLPDVKLWSDAWAEFVPFLAYDVGICKVICSTNAIESVNARIRKTVRARGHFPTESAGPKCVYLALMSLDPTGKGRRRWTMRWKAPLNAFQIAFDGRLSPSSR